jgi:hypothetical protein
VLSEDFVATYFKLRSIAGLSDASDSKIIELAEKSISLHGCEREKMMWEAENKPRSMNLGA